MDLYNRFVSISYYFICIFWETVFVEFEVKGQGQTDRRQGVAWKRVKGVQIRLRDYDRHPDYRSRPLVPVHTK